MNLNNKEQPWYKRLWFIILSVVLLLLILIGSIVGIIFATKDNKGGGEVVHGDNYIDLNIDYTDHAISKKVDYVKEDKWNFIYDLRMEITTDLTFDYIFEKGIDTEGNDTYYFDVILYAENFNWNVDVQNRNDEQVILANNSFGQVLVERTFYYSPADFDYSIYNETVFYTDHVVWEHDNINGTIPGEEEYADYDSEDLDIDSTTKLNYIGDSTEPQIDNIEISTSFWTDSVSIKDWDGVIDVVDNHLEIDYWNYVSWTSIDGSENSHSPYVEFTDWFAENYTQDVAVKYSFNELSHFINGFEY